MTAAVVVDEGDQVRVQRQVAALAELADAFDVLFPVHPRTRAQIEQLHAAPLGESAGVAGKRARYAGTARKLIAAL